MSVTAPVSPEVVFDALFAHQQTAAMKAGIDLDVFTAIDEGATDAAAIAARAKASPRGMRILCDFLVTIGMLTKQGDRYGLAPSAAAFLSRKSPMYMGTMANFLTHPDLTRNFDDLTGAVRRGGVLPQGSTVADENPLWVEFARSMVPMAMANAQAIASMLTLPSSGQILDIAAGHGMYGIVLAQRNPGMHVTALDWAPVLVVASEHAKQAGVEARFSARPGDAFKTPLGENYDLVLITNFLHHFNVAANTAFLKRVHASLKPGGQVAIVEFVPNPDRVSPPTAARFSLTMLAGTPEGDAYTFEELRGMLDAAGFSDARPQALPTPQTLVVARR